MCLPQAICVAGAPFGLDVPKLHMSHLRRGRLRRDMSSYVKSSYAHLDVCSHQYVIIYVALCIINMSSYTSHICLSRFASAGDYFGLDMLKLHKDLQNVSVLAAHPFQVCTGCRV